MARAQKTAETSARAKVRPDWPAARPTWRALTRIHPHPQNPRTHPPAQVALLAELMKRHGVDQPIVVDEQSVILKGHGRRLAAIQAGFEEFPVVVHRGLPEVEKTAMRMADNQTALLSGWDRELMAPAIAELRTAGYQMSLLGFSEVQLRSWSVTAAPGASDHPDTVPEPPKAPTVRKDDLWELGEHRVLCGDSTAAENWKRLFAGSTAAMVFTDPPYGVSYQAPSGEFAVIQGDDKRRDELYKMLVGSLKQMARHTVDRAAIYIWHASSTREDFAQAMKAAGIVERQYLMWVKPSFVLGHDDYMWQHEPCFYASRADQKPAFYGDRAEGTVWHVQLVAAKEIATTIGNGMVILDGEGGTLYVQSRAPKNKKLRQIRITKNTSVMLSGADRRDGTAWEVARDPGHEHPTQKPVELARRAIENSSRPGEIVADGFLGSGTTLIGAEITGRRCYGLELDPTYAEVIIRRWERLTGQRATLDGRTLEQVAKMRQPRKRPASRPRKPPVSQKKRGRPQAPPPTASPAKPAKPGAAPAPAHAPPATQR